MQTYCRRLNSMASNTRYFLPLSKFVNSVLLLHAWPSNPFAKPCGSLDLLALWGQNVEQADHPVPRTRREQKRISITGRLLSKIKIQKLPMSFVSVCKSLQMLELEHLRRTRSLYTTILLLLQSLETITLWIWTKHIMR